MWVAYTTRWCTQANATPSARPPVDLNPSFLPGAAAAQHCLEGLVLKWVAVLGTVACKLSTALPDRPHFLRWLASAVREHPLRHTASWT